MSIFSSLYIGMSGMRSNEGAIGVIGNNIANLNTVGYKGSRAVFADVLSQTVLGSAGMSQQGQGVGLASVQRVVTQGALLGTGVSTDLAISGDGYFVVDDAAGNRFFTRNGQLQLDADGFLNNVEGFRIQGYPADANGVLGTRLGPLDIGNRTSPPQATNGIAMVVNLDSGAPIQDVGAFDPDNPGAESSFSQSVTVYDSLGTAQQVDVYFTRTAEGEWTWNAVVDDGQLQGGIEGTNTIIASGTLSFDTDGKLLDETQNQSNVTFAGATSQDLLFDFGDEISNGGNGDGSSGYDGQSTASFVDQDGFGVGSLAFVEIDQEGLISGTFTNGRELVLGQLAVARFEAPGQLNAVGQNRFTATHLSGEPAIGAAGSGGRGTVFSGTLEQSNVDLTNEFTQLIVAQRGFQAASRTITTADEMLIEVVNLKR